MPEASALLSRDRILEATLDLVDADGVGAFSMRRLAGELGVSAPTLYWHFRNRDDLLAAAAEHALGGMDLRVRGGEPWDAQAHRLLGSVWDSARRHPGLLHLVRTRPEYPRAGRQLMQALLVVLRRAGFGPADAVGHARSLIWATFGFLRATDPAVLGGAGRHRGPRRIRVDVDLDEVAGPDLDCVAECLPHLASLDVDELFHRTLDALLAGIPRPAPVRTSGPHPARGRAHKSAPGTRRTDEEETG